MRGYYAGFAEQLTAVSAAWQCVGVIAADAVPAQIARTLLAVALGFVLEATILGDVDPAGIRSGLGAIAEAEHL